MSLPASWTTVAGAPHGGLYECSQCPCGNTVDSYGHYVYDTASAKLSSVPWSAVPAHQRSYRAAPPGSYLASYAYAESVVDEPRCECGSVATYGSLAAAGSAHSYWCPVAPGGGRA